MRAVFHVPFVLSVAPQARSRRTKAETLPTPRLIVIAGPTASGKTSLAIDLARRLGGETVNADSQQVYRGLDVGTAKPTPEEGAAATPHLRDVVEPGEGMDASRFVALADAAVAW